MDYSHFSRIRLHTFQFICRCLALVFALRLIETVSHGQLESVAIAIVPLVTENAILAQTPPLTAGIKQVSHFQIQAQFILQKCLHAIDGSIKVGVLMHECQIACGIVFHITPQHVRMRQLHHILKSDVQIRFVVFHRLISEVLFLQLNCQLRRPDFE